MKRILLMIIIAATSAITMAQPRQNMTISGHITDIDAKEPIEQATIQMFWKKDSTFVGGTLSDVQGNFSIVSIPNKTYFAYCRSIVPLSAQNTFYYVQSK